MGRYCQSFCFQFIISPNKIWQNFQLAQLGHFRKSYRCLYSIAILELQMTNYQFFRFQSPVQRCDKTFNSIRELFSIPLAWISFTISKHVPSRDITKEDISTIANGIPIPQYFRPSSRHLIGNCARDGYIWRPREFENTWVQFKTWDGWNKQNANLLLNDQTILW